MRCATLTSLSISPDAVIFDCVILTPKVHQEGYDRLHYCGNCTDFPAVKFECPQNVLSGFSFLCFDEDTKGCFLLYTDSLQAYFKLIKKNKEFSKPNSGPSALLTEQIRCFSRCSQTLLVVFCIRELWLH